MSPRKIFLTVGAIWAPPLAVAATIIATERYFRYTGTFSLTVLILAALMAFAGSIFAGNRYGKRLARKKPSAWAANVGVLLIALGLVANTVFVIGFFNLPMLHDDDIPFEYLTEETARQPAGE